MKQSDFRIALAHDHLYQIGGAEHVLKELHALYPTAPIYTLIRDRKHSDFVASGKIITSFLQKMPGGKRFFKWYLPLMPRAWEQLDFSDYDVVLSSSSSFVKGLIAPPGTLHVTYCHTPTRFLWSDSDVYINSLAIPQPVRMYVKYLINQLRQWDLD